MLRHIKVDRTFKENTYGGQYNPNRMRNASQYVVDAILEQVLNGIIRAQMPFTKAQNFTLVNVYCPDVQLSMGYSSVPDASTIMVDSGLVFTFSLRPRPLRKLPEPNYSNGRSRYFRMWGETDINEYLTIGIPRQYSFALNGAGLEFLNALYNVVGSVTRNFVNVEPQPEYAPRYSNQDICVTQGQDFGIGIQQAMRLLPYTSWQNSLDMWKLNSLMLSPKLFGDKFPQYFCTYILPSLYLPDVAPSCIAYIDKTCVDFVAKGLMKISSAFASGIPDTGPEMQTALFLLLSQFTDASDLEGFETDRINYVRKYFDLLNRNMQRLPEYQSKLVVAAGSNHASMARNLIFGRYNTQVRSLAEYLSLTEVNDASS